MPRRYCGSCRSPLQEPMTVTASVFPAWEIPCRCRAPLASDFFSLREHQSSPLCARGSLFFSESDPAPRALPFFLPPGTCEEKTAGQRFSAPVEKASSRRLRSRVPRFSPHREVSLPSVFFPTWPSSLCKRERSGLVRGKWRWLADDSMSL